jgi:mannose-1-phosphate guanylyltransferase
MDHLVKNGLLSSSVVIHPTATVHKSAQLGPGVVIGPHVIVEEGARLVRTCVLEGSIVKAHAVLIDSIVGWKSSIHSWSHVNSSVLGEDVVVSDLLCVNGALILPHKTISESIWQSGRIVM